ncbi:hypothetical protein XENTR_v10016036 [Xenopus tropicalis]|nr:hypothetical protein XENTR_v10016036 [Xenopus tropicalis]
MHSSSKSQPAKNAKLLIANGNPHAPEKSHNLAATMFSNMPLHAHTPGSAIVPLPAYRSKRAGRLCLLPGDARWFAEELGSVCIMCVYLSPSSSTPPPPPPPPPPTHDSLLLLLLLQLHFPVSPLTGGSHTATAAPTWEGTTPLGGVH